MRRGCTDRVMPRRSRSSPCLQQLTRAALPQDPPFDRDEVVPDPKGYEEDTEDKDETELPAAQLVTTRAAPPATESS